MEKHLNPNGSYRHKPGDKIFRVPRVKPWRITIARIKPTKPIGVSLMTLVYGFAVMIALGTILLMLPIASESNQWTSLVDSLFTATSAVCVTGLVVVDTLNHWSFFGELVILVLIQLGGLGFMTSTTIFLMAAGRKIGLRGRILIGESLGLSQIGGVVRLARDIALFAFISEAVGAAIFYARFSTEHGWLAGAWKSIFQAVSAFNNAGFDLFGGFKSLTGHSSDALVLLTTAVLVILGGISFRVLQNVYHSRGIRKSLVDTKLVLLVTAILLALGTMVVLATEFYNPQTLGTMPLSGKILNAFFQSVTSRSSGFSTFNVGAMVIYALYFTMALMFIGGATGSTTGGIKVNTLGLIIATIWGTIRGREHPGAFGREFHVQQIYRAMTLVVLYIGIIGILFLILTFTERFHFLDILFETVSAAGTVGLTTGITPGLSTFGRLVVIITMFIGRLGPLTITMSLTRTLQTTIYRYPKESVRIG